MRMKRFMNELKTHKLWQILISIACSSYVLLLGYLSGETIQFICDSLNQTAAIIILAIYVVLFAVFMCLAAFVSKKYDLKHLFYPSATINLVSIVSACICCQYPDAWWLIFLPFIKPFGAPVAAVSSAIEYSTTITEDFIGGVYSGYGVSFIYEKDAVFLFFVLAIISIVFYELYTANPAQDIKKAGWRLQKPARRVALGLIITYGSCALLTALSMPFVSKTDAMLPEMIIGIIGIMGMVASITFAIYIIPIVCGIYLVVHCIKQARRKKSLKQIFNPLVFMAVLATIVGTYALTCCMVITYIGFQD